MPYTLNGIGTHYYGAANRSAHVGVCKACGKSATISSYDTREWICVLFIPIIPLTRYRILDDCSRCRRHHRISARDFSDKLQTTLAPLRVKIRHAPTDPEPQLELIRTLIGWQMRTEAQAELQKAQKAFPQNVDFMLCDAEMAVDRGDWNYALPLYEKAHKLEPQNATAAYSYAWLLHEMQRYEQAIGILQSSAAQEANAKGTLYLLGDSQMKLTRWNDALSTFQKLVALEPKYLGDKSLLRQMRECKLHLGYELTDAERRAGRRWWPFGGKKSRPATPSAAPTIVRPSLRYAGIAILAVMLIGGGIYVLDKRSNIEVYVDNGMQQSVRVDLDGRHFDLGRNARSMETLKEGAHNIAIHQKDGKEIEHMTFRVDNQSIFDAMFHDRFYVYNIASQHVYRRARHGYAKNREGASYSDELIGMQRFFEQRDVDYPFQGAPDSITVDSNRSSAVIKVSFNVADDIDLATYAFVRLQQGAAQEAKAAIDHAVSNAPCDTRTRRSQVYFASVATGLDAASDAAHHWISDCSQDDLEAHRAYQDVNNENERREAMRAEYRKLLDASPNSGKAHYLYGRVAADPNVAISEYQQAIHLDPKLVWPRVALGHAYASMERYDDALREFGAAIDMEGRDPSVLVYYAAAAIGKGDPNAAAARIDEVRKASPREPGAAHARWLLALSTHDWQTASSMETKLVEDDGPQTAWWRKVRVLRMKDDPFVDTKIEAAMQQKALRPLALRERVERMLEKGEFAKAAETMASHSKEMAPNDLALFEAYAAGGLLMQGDTAAAGKILDEAEKTAGAAKKSREHTVAVAVIDGLRGTKSVDEVIATTRESDAIAHGWFVAAVRAAMTHDRVREKDSLTHCMRAASDLDFPYLETRAMAAKLDAGS